MTNTTSKRGFGRRVNSWLDEPHGEIFKHGKWRFWFPALVGFSILNALLTAVVFGSGGNLQTYLGAVILSVGALLAWLGIGALHYSDSHDRQLARSLTNSSPKARVWKRRSERKCNVSDLRLKFEQE